MTALRIKAAVAASLLGTSLASLAGAGENATSAVDARSQRDAVVNAFFEHMDTNKDAQVTRLEAELASKSLFAKLDANGDGEITKAEAESRARALRKQELTGQFKTLDASGDGQLTAEEAKLPSAVFDRLDADKDRNVTFEEFQSLPGVVGARPPLEFERADLNHDGKVTREEGGRSAQERFNMIDANKDNLITRAELEARVDALLKEGTKKAIPAAAPR